MELRELRSCESCKVRSAGSSRSPKVTKIIAQGETLGPGRILDSLPEGEQIRRFCSTLSGSGRGFCVVPRVTGFALTLGYYICRFQRRGMILISRQSLAVGLSRIFAIFCEPQTKKSGEASTFTLPKSGPKNQKPKAPSESIKLGLLFLIEGPLITNGRCIPSRSDQIKKAHDSMGQIQYESPWILFL